MGLPIFLPICQSLHVSTARVKWRAQLPKMRILVRPLWIPLHPGNQQRTADSNNKSLEISLTRMRRRTTSLSWTLTPLIIFVHLRKGFSVALVVWFRIGTQGRIVKNVCFPKPFYSTLPVHKQSNGVLIWKRGSGGLTRFPNLVANLFCSYHSGGLPQPGWIPVLLLGLSGC